MVLPVPVMVPGSPVTLFEVQVTPLMVPPVTVAVMVATPPG